MRVYFRNRFQREYRTCIIAHSVKCDIDRCRMSGEWEEIPEVEAFRLVRTLGHLPHVELWGLALEGCEHNDRRRTSTGWRTDIIVPRDDVEVTPV